MSSFFYGTLGAAPVFMGLNSGATGSVTGFMTPIGQNAGVSLTIVETPQSFLYVYSGPVPDFTTLTSTTATRLIDFPQSAANNSWQDMGIKDPGTVNCRYEFLFGACTASTAAAASGVATWFALCSGSSFVNTFSDRATIFGTIGLPGSNADLIMTDVNVVSGSSYTCAGFRVSFPQTWTLA